MNPASYEAIKSTTANYNQELVQKRVQVRDDIEAMVKARLLPYHIIAETTSITDFKFPKTFEGSIEAKQVAQQEAVRRQNEILYRSFRVVCFGVRTTRLCRWSAHAHVHV